MNENDAFYNALIDVAAWDKENTLDPVSYTHLTLPTILLV